MNVVSINDHVLTKVLVGTESMDVWWRWLVHRPVVEWWVPDWVLSLSKLCALLGIFLGNFYFIWANSHFHTEIGISHGVGHEDWVDVHWNAFFLTESLLGSVGSSLLLLKLNFIWTNEHFQVKLGISHGILHDNWVDMNWNSLGKRGLIVMLFKLCKLESNWCWMVGDEILKSSNGHVVVKKSEIIFLSELQSNWSWMVGNKILESSDRYIIIKKSEVILLSLGLLLGKLEGDWCWVVSDKVLESSNGDIVVEESKVVLLSLLLS